MYINIIYLLFLYVVLYFVYTNFRFIFLPTEIGQYICNNFWLSIYDLSFWLMNFFFDELFWWTFLMNFFDGPFLMNLFFMNFFRWTFTDKPLLTNISDEHFWWIFLKNTFDEHSWWTFFIWTLIISSAVLDCYLMDLLDKT